MTRFRLLAAIVLVTLGAAGCVTMSVSSHLERGVAFTQFRTWDWGNPDGLPTADPRLDNNAFFIDRLEGALEQGFARHGFARAEPGSTPDLLVHYHANVSQRFQVSEPLNCVPGNCEPRTIDYEQGTLVIDVVDTRTNKVVWRGWAQDSLQGVIDNQARLEKQVNEAVTKLMVRFPN